MMRKMQTARTVFICVLHASPLCPMNRTPSMAHSQSVDALVQGIPQTNMFPKHVRSTCESNMWQLKRQGHGTKAKLRQKTKWTCFPEDVSPLFQVVSFYSTSEQPHHHQVISDQTVWVTLWGELHNGSPPESYIPSRPFTVSIFTLGKLKRFNSWLKVVKQCHLIHATILYIGNLDLTVSYIPVLFHLWN